MFWYACVFCLYLAYLFLEGIGNNWFYCCCFYFVFVPEEVYCWEFLVQFFSFFSLSLLIFFLNVRTDQFKKEKKKKEEEVYMEYCEGYSWVRVQSLVLFFLTRLCNMTTVLVTYIFFAPNICFTFFFMCAISALRSLSLVWDTRVHSPYPPPPPPPNKKHNSPTPNKQKQNNPKSEELCVHVFIYIYILLHSYLQFGVRLYFLAIKHSPDVTLCSWLGSKHQLTKLNCHSGWQYFFLIDSSFLKLPSLPIIWEL